MRILVAGGTGYLGRHLVDSLLERGISVRIGTRQPEPLVRASFPSNVEFARFDPGQGFDDLDQTVADCDAIVNLVSMPAHHCNLQPERAWQVNVEGTRQLLAAAVSHSISRFLYLSTIHVFGSAMSGKIDERTLPRPTHLYGITHLEAEKLVFDSQLGQATVLRISNAFGAPKTSDGSGWNLFVNQLCRQAVERSELSLQSCGKPFRDFVAVSNVVKAMEFLTLQELPRITTPLHLGGQKTWTLLEMADLVADRWWRLGHARPEVRTGDGQEVGDYFEFQMDDLRKLGFVPSKPIVDEIDDSLIQCQSFRPSVQA